MEWAVTKFGNGVDNAAVDVDVDDAVAAMDDDGDGRGRVKYAHADNSDDPDPFPGPKVVRKAGWMGRLLLRLLLLTADLAVGLGARVLSVVAVVDATADCGAVTLDAEEAMASTIAMAMSE